jgi:hypothetical protein
VCVQAHLQQRALDSGRSFNVLLADEEFIPFPDKSFDCVSSCSDNVVHDVLHLSIHSHGARPDPESYNTRPTCSSCGVQQLTLGE